ncbi:uncharacterized protein LOC102933687 isoform X2 [Chelonia mydas]|uniref:uncharacterized protein LOC102933687 isoform X2 n=1 Tax=Chelonia mydas TaxID=8469 RepID=UPI001CA8598A|nr:uncharacterized protein LOC102933687 isoform X2 [Chelonia mydas]
MVFKVNPFTGVYYKGRSKDALAEFKIREGPRFREQSITEPGSCRRDPDEICWARGAAAGVDTKNHEQALEVRRSEAGISAALWTLLPPAQTQLHRKREPGTCTSVHSSCALQREDGHGDRSAGKLQMEERFNGNENAEGGGENSIQQHQQLMEPLNCHGHLDGGDKPGYSCNCKFKKRALVVGVLLVLIIIIIALAGEFPALGLCTSCFTLERSQLHIRTSSASNFRSLAL